MLLQKSTTDLIFSNDCIIDNRRLPEEKLVYQILYRAITDCTATSDLTVPIVDQKSALSWILSKRKTSFSYLWCCELLNLDPQNLIRYLAEKNLIKKIRSKFVPYKNVRQKIKLWKLKKDNYKYL